MGGGAGKGAPAGGTADANTLRALKAEEASINARLESARKELAKADELKSQQNFIESQIEAMRKLQFEEAHKLEVLQKEASEMAGQLEQRRAMSPQEMSANLSQQDQELVQKIDTHRKEEMLLARKIEEIRKKVIDLDRRIEARRKEEAEIGSRIEAKRREEEALDQKLGG
jgi:chromosome segregation ATPase